jgi:hypothetical protein
MRDNLVPDEDDRWMQELLADIERDCRPLGTPAEVDQHEGAHRG